MAPLPPAPGVFQVTTTGELAGQTCDHVINWLCNSGAANPTAASLAFATADASTWMRQFAGILPTAYTHVASTCQYLGDLTTRPQTVAAGGAGTLANGFSSFGTCVTARHVSAIRGKGKDGRTNWPGPPSQSVDQATGQILEADVTDYQNRYNLYEGTIIGALNTAGFAGAVVTILTRKTGLVHGVLETTIDLFPNTHRRWQKRLARH